MRVFLSFLFFISCLFGRSLQASETAKEFSFSFQSDPYERASVTLVYLNSEGKEETKKSGFEDDKTHARRLMLDRILHELHYAAASKNGFLSEEKKNEELKKLADKRAEHLSQEQKNLSFPEEEPLKKALMYLQEAHSAWETPSLKKEFSLSLWNEDLEAEKTLQSFCTKLPGLQARDPFLHLLPAELFDFILHFSGHRTDLKCFSLVRYRAVSRGWKLFIDDMLSRQPLLQWQLKLLPTHQRDALYQKHIGSFIGSQKIDRLTYKDLEKSKAALEHFKDKPYILLNLYAPSTDRNSLASRPLNKILFMTQQGLNLFFSDTYRPLERYFGTKDFLGADHNPEAIENLLNFLETHKNLLDFLKTLAHKNDSFVTQRMQFNQYLPLVKAIGFRKNIEQGLYFNIGRSTNQQEILTQGTKKEDLFPEVQDFINQIKPSRWPQTKEEAEKAFLYYALRTELLSTTEAQNEREAFLKELQTLSATLKTLKNKEILTAYQDLYFKALEHSLIPLFKDTNPPKSSLQTTLPLIVTHWLEHGREDQALSLLHRTKNSAWITHDNQPMDLSRNWEDQYASDARRPFYLLLGHFFALSNHENQNYRLKAQTAYYFFRGGDLRRAKAYIPKKTEIPQGSWKTLAKTVFLYAALGKEQSAKSLIERPLKLYNTEGIYFAEFDPMVFNCGWHHRSIVLLPEHWSSADALYKTFQEALKLFK